MLDEFGGVEVIEILYKLRIPIAPSGGGPAYESRYEVCQMILEKLRPFNVNYPSRKIWISYEISLGELFENQYNERWAEENLQWMRSNKNLNRSN